MSHSLNTSPTKILNELIDENFNEKDFIEQAINSDKISLYLSDLATTINIMDKKIHKEINANESELMKQALKLDSIEDDVINLKTQSDALQSSFQLSHQKANELYSQLSRANLIFSRAHQVCCILRRIYTIVNNIVRLDELVNLSRSGDSTCLYPAAIVISQIDMLIEDPKLENIEMINDLKQHVSDTRQFVIKNALDIIMNGLIDTSASAVLSGLKILMKKLAFALNPFIEEFFTKFSKTSFSVWKKHGKAKRSNLGSNFLTKLRKLFEEALKVWKMIDLLERCLISYFEDISSDAVLYRESVDFLKPYDLCLKSKFVSTFSKDISEILKVTLKDDPLLKDYLEMQYVVVHQCLYQFIHSVLINMALNDFSNSKPSENIGFSFILKEKHFKEVFSLSMLEEPIVDAFNIVENSFLSRTFNKLNSVVNNLFSDTRRISSLKLTDIEIIIGELQKLLEICKNDSYGSIRLSKLIARKVIAKNIKFIRIKVENLIAVFECSKLIADTVQIQNAAMINTVDRVYTSINDMINNIGDDISSEVISIVRSANESLAEFVNETISMIMSYLVNTVETIIGTMDVSNYTCFNEKSSAVVGRSGFIKELEEFVGRASTNTLSLYCCEQIISNKLGLVVSTMVNTFIWKITVCTRPINSIGLRKLQVDFTRMEFILNRLTQQYNGAARSELEEFKLFQLIIDQIVDGKEIEINIDGSNIQVTKLLSFIMTFGPKEMQTPFQISGMNVKEYLSLSHDGSDVEYLFGLIRTCIQDYVRCVQKLNLKEFHFIYPSLINLFPDSLF